MTDRDGPAHGREEVTGALPHPQRTIAELLDTLDRSDALREAQYAALETALTLMRAGGRTDRPAEAADLLRDALGSARATVLTTGYALTTTTDLSRTHRSAPRTERPRERVGAMKQLHADYTDPAADHRIDVRDADAAARLVSQIDAYGFAVARSGESGSPEGALEHLAGICGLGTPVTPETAHLTSDASPYKHVSAYTDIEGWHVDGLLEELGTVRTTALYCVRAARSGGATAVFNTPAAFMELRAADRPAADALLAPTVLTRRAKLVTGGYGQSVTGPAFALAEDGTVSTRYSDNHTCRWNHSVGEPGAVERALDFMRRAATEKRLHLAVRLAPGESLLLRNDRLAHDRTRYEDDPDAPRLLVRALYHGVPHEG
ncbi:TauD/TfdA family dioxygenase [Streptomyces sp. NPDC012693]|jgi:alpha-ketoglutarate-dependent taurine dioxygenase|uniref:TauD/TfdA family dioxygenase n=1 Tax=unclassified Streptomyces TaxID=2593676 RepID=UPI002030B59A|nr:TauD/TfdA family dioxygenase [Streptomyces sp. MSC1_001]